MPDDDAHMPILVHIQTILFETDRRYQQQIDDLRLMLDERYVTQVKAVDAAFAAQQTAMQTALLAAEKAVQTALMAAEKAVTKAEAAAEKRFDAVNEFRAAYQDIISTQMPRAEAEQRLQAMAEKVADLKIVASATAGHSAGMSDSAKLLIGFLGIVTTVTTIIGAVLAFRR